MLDFLFVSSLAMGLIGCVYWAYLCLMRRDIYKPAGGQKYQWDAQAPEPEAPHRRGSYLGYYT